jgi:hypothetical protein
MSTTGQLVSNGAFPILYIIVHHPSDAHPNWQLNKWLDGYRLAGITTTPEWRVSAARNRSSTFSDVDASGFVNAR